MATRRQTRWHMLFECEDADGEAKEERLRMHSWLAGNLERLCTQQAALVCTALTQGGRGVADYQRLSALRFCVGLPDAPDADAAGDRALQLGLGRLFYGGVAKLHAATYAANQRASAGNPNLAWRTLDRSVWMRRMGHRERHATGHASFRCFRALRIYASAAAACTRSAPRDVDGASWEAIGRRAARLYLQRAQLCASLRAFRQAASRAPGASLSRRTLPLRAAGPAPRDPLHAAFCHAVRALLLLRAEGHSTLSVDEEHFRAADELERRCGAGAAKLAARQAARAAAADARTADKAAADANRQQQRDRSRDARSEAKAAAERMDAERRRTLPEREARLRPARLKRGRDVEDEHSRGEAENAATELAAEPGRPRPRLPRPTEVLESSITRDYERAAADRTAVAGRRADRPEPPPGPTAPLGVAPQPRRVAIFAG